MDLKKTKLTKIGKSYWWGSMGCSWCPLEAHPASHLKPAVKTLTRVKSKSKKPNQTKTKSSHPASFFLDPGFISKRINSLLHLSHRTPTHVGLLKFCTQEHQRHFCAWHSKGPGAHVLFLSLLIGLVPLAHKTLLQNTHSRIELMQVVTHIYNPKI